MYDKTNLWEETIADLEVNGKKWEDVEFVCTDDYVLVNFEKEAKEIYYDSGYGGAEIPMNLKVVGSDFWMERHEYDGSEWWEYKTMPKKPKWCADAKPVLHCSDPVVVMQTEQHWIPCEERLPEDGERVLVWANDSVDVVTFEMGISQETREKMKNGEIPDPILTTWYLADGYKEVKRSNVYDRSDEAWNNKKPYCWIHGFMEYFGQDVIAWMPLPKPYKEERESDETDITNED